MAETGGNNTGKLSHGGLLARAEAIRKQMTETGDAVGDAVVVEPSEEEARALVAKQAAERAARKKKADSAFAELERIYEEKQAAPRVEGEERRHERRKGEENKLSVVELHKNFGRKEVVRGVGFAMHGGEIAGLLGPNGAGKTTIFYMIVGFLRPTHGNVLLNTEDITVGPMYKRARLGIAYLPQEASIFRKLTVEQNIWAILQSRKDLKKKEKKDLLDELIEEFSIGRIRKQFGYTLSGGERRRTEIARALATDPKFLLLDEPFAGIDPIAVHEIKEIIKKLAEKGIGVLITDHNVRDTLEITSIGLIINKGVIVARGGKEQIVNNPLVREVYLGQSFTM
jgi:lipopolysaccharide export system ATP-binding protein